MRSRSRLVALLAILSGCAAPHAASVVVSRRPIAAEPTARDDASSGVIDVHAACRAGDDDACFALFRERHEDEEAELRTLYRQTCEEHAPAGCIGLVVLARDPQLAQERALGLSRLGAGCATSPRACIDLGDHLDNPDNREFDPEAALRAYEAGCALEDVRACERVVERRLSRGRTADHMAQAFVFAERACDIDPARGCPILAGLLVSPLAGPRMDVPRARALLEASCRGHGQGCDALIDAILAHQVRDLSVDEVYTWLEATRGQDAVDDTQERRELRSGLAPACERVDVSLDDTRAVARFATESARTLRRPGVRIAAVLPAGLERALTVLFAPLVCPDARQFALRWLRPIRVTPDGVDVLVEWAGSVVETESAAMHTLHASIVRITNGRPVLLQDEVFAFQYISMGLGSWRRHARDDLDRDGLPDVVLVYLEGVDDASSETLAFVSSRTGRIETISMGSNQGAMVDGCFMPGADGPTLVVTAVDRGNEDEDLEPAACAGAARFDAVRGPVSVPIAASIGEPIALEPDRLGRFSPERVAELARVRGGRLAAPHASWSASDYDVEAITADDARHFRSDSADRRLGLCPQRALFPLFEGTDDALTHVRFARLTIPSTTNERVVTPEVDRTTFCDTFP